MCHGNIHGIIMDVAAWLVRGGISQNSTTLQGIKAMKKLVIRWETLDFGVSVKTQGTPFLFTSK